MNNLGSKHLVIADTQVKPASDLGYLKALGNYIVEKRPDVIVHIGDHWDFESLSFYDKGKKAFEGRRLKADIEAGYEGMKVIMDPIRKLQRSQKMFKKKVYSPRLVFCTGNHEDRLDRVSRDNPEFDGFIGSDKLGLQELGWEVHPYLNVVPIDGIHYTHYLANPFSGKPYGGTAMNQLKTVGRSFVVGHKQCLDIAIRPTIDGKMQIGIINGAYYPHDEDYKGPQGNNHFRGVTMLHEVNDGFGCPCFISLDYLMKRYA